MNVKATMLLAFALLISAAQGQEKGNADAKALEGTWKITRLGGEDAKQFEAALGRPFVIIKDGRFTMFVTKEGENVKYVEYLFTADAKKSPATIDFKIEYLARQTKESMAREKGKVLPSIYELKGDTLRIQPAGDDRKHGLSDKEDGMVLVREKK